MRCLEVLQRGQALSLAEVEALLATAKEVLRAEPTLVRLPAPVTVVGDIHGQFSDLMELFKISGAPPHTSMLFLGDYVDRGSQSVECFCYVLALKARFPQRVALLRGNHESREINRVYGFYDECSAKFGEGRVWGLFTEVFALLPLCALIEGRVMCLHGGLSPACEGLDQVAALDRFADVPHEGLMCDLLWSDPHERLRGFRPSPRSAGYLFGPDVTERFLHANGLSLIARAHQLTMPGYAQLHDTRVCTIFSAPNYCYRCGNLAALMEVEDDLQVSYTQFQHAEDAREPRVAGECPAYFL